MYPYDFMSVPDSYEIGRHKLSIVTIIIDGGFVSMSLLLQMTSAVLTVT